MIPGNGSDYIFWRKSRGKNSEWLRTKDGFVLIVWPRWDTGVKQVNFSFLIAHDYGKPEIWNAFETLEGAKHAAVERLNRIRRTNRSHDSNPT